MGEQQTFGGDWTSDKLERIRKYLHAYTTIFAKNPRAQKLTPIYVDAFAGTGYRSKPQQADDDSPLFDEFADPETQGFLKGSARIALEIEPAFQRYIFIEKDTSRAQKLEALKQDFPQKANAIQIVQEDANTYLKNWCRNTDWRSTRAVVFLDPYGMQVEWSLIEAIAETQAIDLWLLFPLGVAVNRLLPRISTPPEGWARALTRIFGTDDWRDAFYMRQTMSTLFGEEEQTKKDADLERIGEFFVKRLKTVFCSVVENPLPLRNSRNVPLYLLCFAAGNPKGAKTAVKIAQHILKK
jgi:three-Cys-motif partner protein